MVTWLAMYRTPLVLICWDCTLGDNKPKMFMAQPWDGHRVHRDSLSNQWVETWRVALKMGYCIFHQIKVNKIQHLWKWMYITCVTDVRCASLIVQPKFVKICAKAGNSSTSWNGRFASAWAGVIASANGPPQCEWGTNGIEGNSMMSSQYHVFLPAYFTTCYLEDQPK